MGDGAADISEDQGKREERSGPRITEWHTTNALFSELIAVAQSLKKIVSDYAREGLSRPK